MEAQPSAKKRKLDTEQEENSNKSTTDMVLLPACVVQEIYSHSKAISNIISEAVKAEAVKAAVKAEAVKAAVKAEAVKAEAVKAEGNSTAQTQDEPTKAKYPKTDKPIPSQTFSFTSSPSSPQDRNISRSRPPSPSSKS